MMPDIATPQPSSQLTFTEDLDSPMDVDPPEGPTEVAPPQAIAPDEQPAKKNPYHLSSHADLMSPEHEAAEERRRRRKALESEEREKARREREAEQQQMTNLVDALSVARERAQVDNTLRAEMPGAQPCTGQAPTFSEAAKQSRSAALENVPSGTSNNTPHDSTTMMDAYADKSHGATGGLNTTRQCPEYNAGVTAGSSQTGNDATLNRLLEHCRTTDERSEKMSSQIDQLSRAFINALELGLLGTHPVTPAQVPPVAPAQPPPVTPSPPQFHTRRNARPGTFRESIPDTKHKPSKETQFHANMRVLIRELLHKGDKNHWPEPPTEDEIENYETFGDPEDGPTVDNFRLDFSRRPLCKSVWNRRATEIVVEQYCRSYNTEEPGEVEKEFLKRLDRIGRDYRQYVRSNEAGSMAGVRGRASVAAERQRRRKRTDTLYQSRLTAIECHETLYRFTPDLKKLSRGGMSEDESDHGGERGALQGRRFKIIKTQWRSLEVTQWLRTMDLIYAGTKINEDQTLGPGNQFRQRYPSALEQVGYPIIGLPRNFYNERWLRSLSPKQRDELCVEPETDISFSVEERQYASKFIGVKGQLQKDRIASSAEADKDEISQWVLTGAGFWEAT
ncbi:hypothetical protein BJY52DRAFT_1276330 [Lactarius psammicola]|nr:hypothetical protein BJY52DRAFT_1276330 [Lactarius psammicola]